MAELSETTEVVAEAAEVVEEVSRALSPRELRFLLGGIGIGLLGGAVVASLVTRRRLETKYNKIAEDEISEMREHFEARTRAGTPKPELDELVTDLGYSEPNTPQAKELEDAIAREEKAIAEVVEEEEAIQTSTGSIPQAAPEEVGEVLEDLKKDTSWDPNDGWDYKTEIANRRPDKPYIIHVDELPETDYTESSLTYYIGDDILCDSDDSVIEDKDGVVGELNLDKFGLGSGDADILYIRNDVLGIQVEVVKNDGHYAEVVHGLQHSYYDYSPVRRRRHRYDDEPR